MNFDHLLNAESLVSLLSLTLMEIVLGIDNIIFVAILSQRLPVEQQRKVRRLGLSLALVMRLALLFALSWIMGLTKPLFVVFGHQISGRDLVMLLGGLFLIFKASHEIYEKLEGEEETHAESSARGRFGWILAQILALDIVFSLDSVITAVGMAPHVPIMVVAMVVAVIVMLIFAEGISSFIEKHPSLKVLALSFLLTIGLLLTAEAFDQHVAKGYVYFAMAFSILVELLNIRMRGKKKQGVALRRKYSENEEPTHEGVIEPPGGPLGRR